RRLPSLPGAVRPQSHQPQARPLPPIPRPLVCKRCKSYVTCISSLLPLSKIPARSRAFRGFNGKASLFTEIHHVNLSRPTVHLMNTGAHTMEEISCSTCHTYLGWHIVRAHSSSERWKEGHFLLELENLTAKMDGV
ncbi:yippee-domain-containing protein, partial [Hymenopellis radicata]